MKRLAMTLCLILVPAAAFAFDTTKRAERIGVLRQFPIDGERQWYVQEAFLKSLQSELKERGFDAFDAEMTFDEASRERVDADFFVEIVAGDAYTSDYGGLGVGNRHMDVTLAVLVSRVAGELRVYDAGTMELIASESLAKRSTAVLPTSVGVGGRHLFAVIALPFIERAQVRRVVNAAARDAASLVTDAIRGR